MSLTRRNFSLLPLALPYTVTSRAVAQARTPEARIKIDTDRVIGEVHPYVFGNFAEHLGRCIYGGLYEEGSPLSDSEGYRTDVINRAGGEAQRFADVLVQYQRDAQVFGPEVTRFRLYVETMEKILPKAKKFIVEPSPNGDQVNVRIVDQLPAAPPPQGARP